MTAVGRWRRASACSTDHVTEQCIEVFAGDGVVGIRSTRHPSDVVVDTPEAFATFVAGVKAGEFDDLL